MPNVPRSTVTYDIDTGFKYHTTIPDGTRVAVTEKIHGASARFLFHNDTFYVGTRKQWNIEGDNIWWKAAAKYPNIETFCRKHPDWILYGEVYGKVQTLRYGTTLENPIRFAAFDIFNTNEFLGVEAKRNYMYEYGIPEVPLVKYIKYDFEKIKEIVSGPSLVNGANHLREGIVVTPFTEMYDRKVGRAILKFVSPEYLELYKSVDKFFYD
jgi:ATP-dependent RNA circularization protein (DNA/RNA ligase family)